MHGSARETVFTKVYRSGFAMSPLRVGIIGMGGYARTLHTTVSVLEKEGECVLVCTCSQRGAEAPEVEQFQMHERGTQIFTDYLEMLNACEIDVIVIPTPVDQHAPMHAECVRRGLAIYLEKPPTLNWAELQRMLAVEATARSKCHVGFNYIVEPTRQEIKRRLLGGEFGRVQGVSLAVAWPRSSAYFDRASWGGALVGDESGELILDCASVHHIASAHDPSVVHCMAVQVLAICIDALMGGALFAGMLQPVWATPVPTTFSTRCFGVEKGECFHGQTWRKSVLSSTVHTTYKGRTRRLWSSPQAPVFQFALRSPTRALPRTKYSRKWCGVNMLL